MTSLLIATYKMKSYKGWSIDVYLYIYNNKKNIRIFSMFKGHVIFKRIHSPPFSAVTLCLVLFVNKNQLPIFFFFEYQKQIFNEKLKIKNTHKSQAKELCGINN